MHDATGELTSDADFVDPAGLSDAELKALIPLLAERERAISDQRRMLHGKIDLLRAEYVARLKRRYEAGSDG